MLLTSKPRANLVPASVAVDPVAEAVVVVVVGLVPLAGQALNGSEVDVAFVTHRSTGTGTSTVASTEAVQPFRGRRRGLTARSLWTLALQH